MHLGKAAISESRNQDIFVGDGHSSNTVDQMSNADANYDNALGVYEVDGLGNIVDVRLLFADVKDASSTSAMITDVEDCNQLGFSSFQMGYSGQKGLKSVTR